MTSAVRRTGFDRSRLDKVFRPRAGIVMFVLMAVVGGLVGKLM